MRKLFEKTCILLIALAMVLSTLFSSFIFTALGDDPQYHPAIPDAGGPYYGYINENILFDASGSTRLFQIVRYRWDFDSDGTYDTAWLNSPYVEHSFASAGTYIVTLQIDDWHEQLTDTTKAYIIEPGEDWPFLQANFTYSIETAVELPSDDPGYCNIYKNMKYVTVNFDASSSFSTYCDLGHGIMYFKWSFGDGTTETRWKSMAHKYPDGYDHVSHAYAILRNLDEDYVVSTNVKLTVGIHDWLGNDVTDSYNQLVILQPLDIPDLNIQHVPVVETSYLARIKGETEWRKNIDAEIGDIIEWKIHVEHVGDEADFSNVGDNVRVVGNYWDEPFMPFMKTFLPDNLLDVRNGVVRFNGVQQDFEETFAEYSFIERDGNMLILLREEIFDIIGSSVADSFPGIGSSKPVPDTLKQIFFNNGYPLSDDTIIIRTDDNFEGWNYFDILGDLEGPFPGEYTRYHLQWWSGAPSLCDDLPPEQDNDACYPSNTITVNKYINGYPESLRYPNTGAIDDSNSWGLWIPWTWTNQYNSEFEIFAGDTIDIEFETTAVAISKEGELVKGEQLNELCVKAQFDSPICAGPLIPFSIDPDVDLPYDKFIVVDPWSVDSVSVNVNPIKVEKLVKEPRFPEPNNWVDSVELLPEDEAEFKCNVKTPPNILLEKGLQIIDYLPHNLEYLETKSVEIKIDLGEDRHIEPIMLVPNDYDVTFTDDEIIWTINKGFATVLGKTSDGTVLEYDVFSEVTIYFNAEIVSVGYGINKFGLGNFTFIIPSYERRTGPGDAYYPNVYEWTDEEILDTVAVLVTGVPNPEIFVKKTVFNGYRWVNQIQEPVGTILQFRIYLENTGNVKLSNIMVTDILPSFLDSNDVHYNDLTRSIYFGPFTLKPGETITIENIEAEIIADGRGANIACANATALVPSEVGIDADGWNLKVVFIEETDEVEIITGPHINLPPEAVDDVAVTDVDTSVVIDILANDLDDGVIDPTTVNILSGPSNGDAEVDPTTGEVTYTPCCEFNGFDSFEYTVKDSEGLTSNVAVVTITVGDPDGPDDPGGVTVELLTPLENSLYFRGQFRREFPLTVVIGPIILEASITNITGVTKVVFFLDDIELCNYTDISETAYSCNLNGRTFGFKTIKVAAYASGIELASEELDVIAFIFGASLVN